MDAQKPSQMQAEEEERLRQELRNLPHVKAPWYFESQLQQRLQQGPSPRGFAARPVLATAVTVIVLAVVGSAGYYTYFAPVPPQPETAPRSVTPSSDSPVQTEQTPREPQPERQPVLLPAEGGSMNSGPSEPVNGVARRSPAVSSQPERGPVEIPAVIPRVDSAAGQDVAPLREQPQVQQRSAPTRVDTGRAIADTVSKRRDSLRISTPDTLRRIR
jgi:hypothetical protein